MSKTKTSKGGTAVATTENPPFSTFSKAVHKRFTELSKNELYVVDVNNKLFEQYLAAFPEGTNPTFREKTEFDCNCCKQFVRRLGNVVGIGPDYKLRSVWDDLDVPFPYKEVADTLSAIVRAANIKHVFRTSEPKYGTRA